MWNQKNQTFENVIFDLYFKTNLLTMFDIINDIETACLLYERLCKWVKTVSWHVISICSTNIVSFELASVFVWQRTSLSWQHTSLSSSLVPVWLSFAEKTCGENQMYKTCGYAEPSCFEEETPVNMANMTDCREGCFCKDGFMRQGEQCVPKSQCGCKFMGDVLKVCISYCQWMSQ